MLSKENCKLVQDAVKLAGDELKEILQPLPNKPVRNSYAHLWREIKLNFNVSSYKECNDDQIFAILDLVERIRKNSK